ncbi:MAG: hypothetical protein WCP29_12760 [Acidobacteriota bacterium]
MTTEPSRFLRACQLFGLHPLVGFGMFAVDWMLFGAEAVTAGLSWPVSIPVGAALAVPCLLIQRHSFGDSWGAAIGKGLLVGLLTAIPTALPSAVPLVGAVLGVARLLGTRQDERRD